MRKIVSLLVILALCVTIGGVYATWNYSSVGGLTVTQDLTVGLTGSGTVTGESLKITANSLVFKIDDTDGDHVGDTVVAEGSITVTYDVSEHNQEAVVLYANVKVNNETYFKTTLTTNELDYSIDDLNGTDVVWTLNASDLKIALSDTNKVTLPTLADYNAFSMPDVIQVTFSTAAA